MTEPDDGLDERLRADGARWRAGQPPPPLPEQDRLASAGGRWPDARWQPIAVAAAVTLLATGGIVLAAVVPRPAKTEPAPVAGAEPTRHRPPLSQLLVRDGDLVTGSGSVVAVAGRPVRFCAPGPAAMPGYPAGEPAPRYCPTGVTLLGANLDRLTGRTERDGVVWGNARIEGRFRAGTLTVTRQDAPQPAPAEQPTTPERPPCAAPAAGWAAGQLDGDALNRLQSYLQAHPDRFSEVVISYPNGLPTGPTDSPGYHRAEVALVGTVADPTAAGRDLRAVFPGNLCVARTPRSRAAVDAVLARVDLDRLAPQVFTVGPDYFAGQVNVALVVLDEQLYRRLAEADRGTGLIEAQPWLTRVGS